MISVCYRWRHRWHHRWQRTLISLRLKTSSTSSSSAPKNLKRARGRGRGALSFACTYSILEPVRYARMLLACADEPQTAVLTCIHDAHGGFTCAFGSCGLHRNLTQKLFFAEYCFAFCDRPHTPVDQLRLIKELSCGTTTYTRGQHTHSRAGEPKPPSNARKNSARRKAEFLSFLGEVINSSTGSGDFLRTRSDPDI